MCAIPILLMRPKRARPRHKAFFGEVECGSQMATPAIRGLSKAVDSGRSDIGFTEGQGSRAYFPRDSLEPAAPVPDFQDVRAEIDSLRNEVERLAAELTDMRAHASLLESLAQEDPLTGLLNRRGFFRELARAIAYRARYGTSIALLLADLDRFKRLNDDHGHEMGDRALVHIATVLRQHVRASDSIGRLGGDEFAVILWQVDETGARQKARMLEDIVAGSPLPVDELGLRLESSIGSTLLEPGDTPEDALSRADQAMYRRKAERRAADR
jgi:diguanylate cyclase (GGDEF)-like protein